MIRLVNLDAMTYAAHQQAVDIQDDMNNVVLIKGDITDKGLVEYLLSPFR